MFRMQAEQEDPDCNGWCSNFWFKEYWENTLGQQKDVIFYY